MQTIHPHLNEVWGFVLMCTRQQLNSRCRETLKSSPRQEQQGFDPRMQRSLRIKIIIKNKNLDFQSLNQQRNLLDLLWFAETDRPAEGWFQMSRAGSTSNPAGSVLHNPVPAGFQTTIWGPSIKVTAGKRGFQLNLIVLMKFHTLNVIFTLFFIFYNTMVLFLGPHKSIQ